MERAFGDILQKEHRRLRCRYYAEVSTILTFLVTLIVGWLYVYIFTEFNLFAPYYVPLIWGSILVFYLVFMVIFLPKRFAYMQSLLFKTFMMRAKEAGLELSAYPQGDVRYNYEGLFAESGIWKKDVPFKIIPFEYKGILIRVLHYKDDDHSSSIIHMPNRNSPYFLQIDNGAFPSLKNYKGTAVSRISFVSPYNLNYYATNGPTNVKIYLRKEVESKFINLLNYRDGLYNYVVTYNDEFLMIEAQELSHLLRLDERYEATYYERSLQTLLDIQNYIKIMIEKGR